MSLSCRRPDGGRTSRPRSTASRSRRKRTSAFGWFHGDGRCRFPGPGPAAAGRPRETHHEEDPVGRQLRLPPAAGPVLSGSEPGRRSVANKVFPTGDFCSPSPGYSAVRLLPHMTQHPADAHIESGKWLSPGDHCRPRRGDFLALSTPSTRIPGTAFNPIVGSGALTDLCVLGCRMVFTSPKGRSTEVSGWSVD